MYISNKLDVNVLFPLDKSYYTTINIFCFLRDVAIIILSQVYCKFDKHKLHQKYLYISL